MNDCSSVAGGRTSRHRARRAMLCAVLLVHSFSISYVRADDGEVSATSSKKAKNDAIRAIPWKELSPQQRRVLRKTTQKTSIYRRLPTRVVDCDPKLFTFLMKHPEVIVDTWRVMGVSKVEIDRIDDNSFRTADGIGTRAKFQYLNTVWTDKAFNRALIFANGEYEGQPFVTPIKGHCAILIRSGSIEETNGRIYITVQLDSFLVLEQLGIELVAKTVRPFVGKVADRNFEETLRFISEFSRAAEKNPQGMERFSYRLTKLDSETRDEFVKICYEVAERSQKRKENEKLAGS